MIKVGYARTRYSFLIEPESEVVKELEQKHEEIKKAKEILCELSEDPEVVKIYEERVKVLNENK